MIEQEEAYNLLNDYIKNKKDFNLPTKDEIVYSGKTEDGKHYVTYTFLFLLKHIYNL